MGRAGRPRGRHTVKQSITNGSLRLGVPEDSLISYYYVAEVLGLREHGVRDLNRIWRDPEFPRIMNRPPVTTRGMLQQWIQTRKYRDVPEAWDVHTYSWWLEYLFPSVSLIVESLITVARKLVDKGLVCEDLAPILPIETQKKLEEADAKIAEAVAAKARILAEAEGPHWVWPKLVFQRLEKEQDA